MIDRSTDLDERYREMKCSAGGVMLLVRLRADMASQPPDSLLRFRTIDALPDPRQAFDGDDRLAATFGWLERRFGTANALRAVIETAGELLKTA